MSETESRINKDSPTEQDWLELLSALRGEARAGRLRSLTFMLQQGADRDRALVDHFGPADLTEIACRKTVERIAISVEKANAALAHAIRDGLPSALAERG